MQTIKNLASICSWEDCFEFCLIKNLGSAHGFVAVHVLNYFSWCRIWSAVCDCGITLSWGDGQGGTPFPVPSPSPHFPPPSPPLPSPFSPTSLPLSDFSLPLINFVLIQELKRIYVSEELRIVHHRLSCRIFMPSRQRTRLSRWMSFLEPTKETLFMLGKTKTSCLWSILAPIQFWAFLGY